MSDQLKHIRLPGPLARALLLLPLGLALTGAWFSVRWYIGDTIAEYVNADNRGLDTARLAANLAPGDPLTHWRLGDIESITLPPEQLGQAIKEYEQAVTLSPNDYRFWLALGRALEQSGDAQQGELAMRRAVDLAPSYAYPRWYLGNLLLRSGHDAAAFAELRRAGEADPQLRQQVFNLAWEVHGKSFDALQSAIGPTAEIRAAFAKYLLDRKAVDDGLRMWNGLSPAEKQESRPTGESILTSLVAAKRFQAALTVWNDLALNDLARGAAGQVLNGGFEQDIGPATASVFGWQVKSAQQAQIGLDASNHQGNHHGGTRSLRILFQARSKPDFEVAQLVIVEPGKQYDLEGFVKTNKLESAGTPIVEVVDSADGSVLASSPPAPAGDNGWQSFVITFKAGVKTEAITIRVSRAPCGDNAVCPIFGTLWYDDFNLKLRS
jgi:hypothetical protein